YTEDELNQLIRINKYFFQFIPDPSHRLITTALEEYPYNIVFVKNQTLQMCEYVIDRYMTYPYFSDFVFDKIQIYTQDMIDKLVTHISIYRIFKTLPDEFKTEENIMNAYKTDCLCMEYFLPHMFTQEICDEAF